MSRKNTASKKKAPLEQKAPDKKIDSEKSSADPKSSGAKSSSAFGYEKLATQTLDLWREQLSHFLNNPDAMKDLDKTSPHLTQMFAPLFSNNFLSNGMDLWLMMLEQLGKAANMNVKTGTSGYDEENSKKSQDRNASTAHQPENRSSAASALSGASTYAVAQLASRIADLEKRFAELEASGRPVAKRAKAKKKTAATALDAAKRAK